jgi:chromate reductase
MPAGYALDIRPIREIPLYDADLEARGTPPPVQLLKAALAEADGLIIASPEYNGSFPGVLKNTLDWLSRPARDIGRIFAGMPVGIIGATTGPMGTVGAQAALLPVFRALRTIIYTDRLLRASHAQEVFDDAGTIQNAEFQARFSSYLQGFCAFATHLNGLRSTSRDHPAP